TDYYRKLHTFPTRRSFDLTVEILISNIQDECIIVNAEQGRVAYPVSVISQEQGIYSYEFIIKYKDGTQETVPNNSYEKIRVFERSEEHTSELQSRFDFVCR